MKSFLILSGAVLGLYLLVPAAFADPGLLYGKIYTVDDEILEGFIRWDKNEASWDDILDGNKELDRKSVRRYRDNRRYPRKKEIKILGITVYREDGDFGWGWSNEAQSGIRFGHIKTLIPVGNDEVILVLKSDEEVELEGGSGDIGVDNREILVDDIKEGILELYWDDIERIEFETTPEKESDFGQRLYGTLTTRRGKEYTGFVCWDVDEVFDTDILDGREKHRKRKIEFGRIQSIERRSSSSAEVTLKNGRSMRLEGTNDIDSGNRGIVVSDLNLGRIKVDWDEFDTIRFTDPPPGPSYNDFDGGRRLYGTVYTEDDEKFTGEVKWDADEEFTWEILDGEYHDVEIDIEFGFIKSIEKVSFHSSRVTLADGRSFKLRGSNDVDSENKGIIIYTDENDEILIDWEDFDKVEFSH
jgi:hypothetical protein